MATMLTNNQTRNLRQASGEELLLLAIFASTGMKTKIDRELDRRAFADTAGGQGVLLHSAPSLSTHAA